MSPIEAQTSLAGALLLIGAILKHAVPSTEVNRWIPLILVVIGVPMYCSLVGSWDPADIVLGIIAAASATGIHQTATRTTGLNL